MTESEFYTSVAGEHFQKEGKEWSVDRFDGKYLIAHTLTNPKQLIYFTVNQAELLTKVAPKPEIVRAKSSHGFPLLERAPLKLPKPHMPSDHTRLICMPVDGGIAEHRQGSEIGPPLPGVIEFLTEAVEHGIDILISTHRPQKAVYQWLRIHCPGAESIVNVTPCPVPAGAVYVSQFAHRIGDTYPPIEELLHAESTLTAS